MASLEPKDSRSTLVDETERKRSGTPHPQSPAPTSPVSPFSASFDPNGSTPATPQGSIFSPMTTMVQNPVPAGNQQVWTSSISTSLSALATQFAAASQALAELPAAPSSSHGISYETIGVMQQAQTKLEQELDSLREQISHLMEGGRRLEKEKERAHEIGIPENLEGRLEAIEKRMDEFAEAMRLDQSRLYARLQNASITTNKTFLTPIAMANGKPPPNFPATKGEFEHLTKERYEQLMKSYGIPIKGDTAAKRQAVREFLGLTPLK